MRIEIKKFSWPSMTHEWHTTQLSSVVQDSVEYDRQSTRRGIEGQIDRVVSIITELMTVMVKKGSLSLDEVQAILEIEENLRPIQEEQP